VQSAAILAGGQATRFGGLDKSALTVDGRTILDRQVAELAPLTSDLLIVSERTYHAAARTIADVVPGCGPLGGLHAALTHARGDAVFLIACDMPYVTTAFIAHLLQFASEADIVVPQTERGYHPLCAVYTRACLEPVARRLADRQLRIRELVADMRTHVVTAEEIDRFGHRHRLLANVNTPAEHAGLEALRSHEL
jgi:molybdenum cofactor guanylyltransferase